MAGWWSTDVTRRANDANQKRLFEGVLGGASSPASVTPLVMSAQLDEPMRTFVAATRTDKAAFIFNGMLPVSNDGDITVFITGALSTVVFH